MKSVLLVDDSISVARQLEKILVESGEFSVVGHGKNGLDAIRLFQTLKPDAILMDMNMPGMDGITALRTLMTLDSSVKVVMVTSLGGVGDKFSEAIRLGARNVISKPFEPENVIKVLRELFS